MEDRVLFPLRLQLHDFESFEELLLPFEVGVQGGGQQRFAEPARPAEEDERALLGHFPDKVGFVNVDVVFFSQPLKGLDADGVSADGVHSGRFYRGKGTIIFDTNK